MNPNSRDDVMYGTGEDEEINAFDPMEVAEKIFDNHCEKAGEPFDEIADRIDWPIKVYEYKRRVVSDSQVKRIIETAIDRALEDLDEEYGDPDGSPTEPTPAMKIAAEAFARIVVAEYVPWSCAQTGKVEEITREQMKKEHDETYCEDEEAAKEGGK